MPRRIVSILEGESLLNDATALVGLRTAIVALSMALAGSFRTLALLSTAARLTTYLVTCIAVPILRKRSEGVYRPSAFVIPFLGALVALLIVVNLDAKRLLAGAIAITIGAILYALTRRRTATVAAVPD